MPDYAYRESDGCRGRGDQAEPVKSTGRGGPREAAMNKSLVTMPEGIYKKTDKVLQYDENDES